MGFPMPGNKILGGTCIASVHYSDAGDSGDNYDRYTVVVLMPEPPFYKVAVVRNEASDNLVEEWTESHRNIVPAINGETNKSSFGYIDMGGDY